MADTLTRAAEAPAPPAELDPSRSEPVVGNGWIFPAVGAVVLTLLWLAYLIPDAMGILSGAR
jgi:hypothetical protein